MTTLCPLAAIDLSSSRFFIHLSSACDKIRCHMRKTILVMICRCLSSSADCTRQASKHIAAVLRCQRMTTLCPLAAIDLRSSVFALHPSNVFQSSALCQRCLTFARTRHARLDLCRISTQASQAPIRWAIWCNRRTCCCRIEILCMSLARICACASSSESSVCCAASDTWRSVARIFLSASNSSLCTSSFCFCTWARIVSVCT